MKRHKVTRRKTSVGSAEVWRHLGTASHSNMDADVEAHDVHGFCQDSDRMSVDTTLSFCIKQREGNETLLRETETYLHTPPRAQRAPQTAARTETRRDCHFSFSSADLTASLHSETDDETLFTQPPQRSKKTCPHNIRPKVQPTPPSTPPKEPVELHVATDPQIAPSLAVGTASSPPRARAAVRGVAVLPQGIEVSPIQAAPMTPEKTEVPFREPLELVAPPVPVLGKTRQRGRGGGGVQLRPRMHMAAAPLTSGGSSMLASDECSTLDMARRVEELEGKVRVLAAGGSGGGGSVQATAANVMPTMLPETSVSVSTRREVSVQDAPHTDAQVLQRIYTLMQALDDKLSSQERAIQSLQLQRRQNI